MITIDYDPDTRHFAAHHLPTGCAPCGDTAGEAFENVLDAVDVYLATVAETAVDVAEPPL